MRKLLSLFLLIALGSPLAAAQVDYRENVGWYAYRDLTSARFSELFDELSGRGYRMTDVEAYPASGGMRYAMMWERNDGRGWAERRNMSSDRYHQRWVEYRDRGYRPTDVEGYMNGGNLQFAGIWVENRENIGWASYRNMTHDSYSTRFSQMSGDGYYLVDMEAYDTPNGLRYAAIWYRNTDNIAWAQLRNMTRSRYQEEVDRRSAQGYVMVDYERYQNNGTKYAAIWHRDGSPGRPVRTNRNETQYANYFRQYRDDGYRPVDFERDGGNYGAIWAKVTPRIADYQHRNALDDLLEDYDSDNNLPGISAAIYHNGRLVWSAGVGGVGSGKDAHGKSVYPLASVSKVIGGTLLARLEDRGELADGRSVSIAGSDLTRRHLGTAPTRHAHTLGQLLSHTACIPHYNTDPGISNQNTHYNTQAVAVRSIWGNDLLDNCTIGASRSYSTHAFTYVGAALEAATGRNVPRLVREELAEAFRLPSMRVMYTDPSLPSNYERSKWYAGGIAVPRGNNSWKAFGGGIESNAVDLARFGWLAGDARLTSAAFRDSTMLVRQPNSSNGYAWSITSQNGRRLVRHGGSWTGARSQLSVWPDHDLSIAILSNQSGHNGLSGLANTMADTILP